MLTLLDERLGDMQEADVGRSRMWLATMAVSAWGLRCVNRDRQPDGGERYLRLFEHSASLAEHPDLFRRVVRDFCLVRRQPLQWRRKAEISHDNAAIKAFLPHYLPLPVVFEHEPPLGHQQVGGIYAKDLREILATLDAEHGNSFAYLYRVSRFLSPQVLRHGNTGEVIAYLPAEARQYLERTIAHPDFADLPRAAQTQLREALAAVLEDLDEDDAMVALQQQLIAEGVSGRAPLLDHYQFRVGALRKRLERHLKLQKREETEKLLANIKAKRDELLRVALADFTFREDTLNVAEVLLDNDRDWEAYDYLERFLRQTAEQDLARLHAALFLAGRYEREAKTRQRARERGLPVEPLVPPGTDPETVDLFTVPDYRAKALAIIALVDPTAYEEADNQGIRAALHCLAQLKRRLERPAGTRETP